MSLVIVQDLSRFARNVADQANAVEFLESCGVNLHSVYDGAVECSATGKLRAAMQGSVNQFFSDSLSERQKGRKRLAALSGRMTWRAPIGYLNTGAKTGVNVVVNAKIAPYIRKAFELIASGLHKQSDVLALLTKQGFSNSRGKPLFKQQFSAMLCHPVYAGWVTLPSAPTFDPVRGLHEPIVSQELYDQVQRVLAGKRSEKVRHKRLNLRFPLRHFTKCGLCGTPLTGAACRSATKRSYDYYWCRNASCKGARLRRTVLEGDFVNYLSRLKANPEVLATLPQLATSVWKERTGDAEREAVKLKRELSQEQDALPKLRKLLLAGTLTAEEYQADKATIVTRIYEIERSLEMNAAYAETAAGFGAFVQVVMNDLGWSGTRSEEGSSKSAVRGWLGIPPSNRHFELGQRLSI